MLFGTAGDTSEATEYTSPSSGNGTIITSIMLCNKNASAQWATVKLNDITILYQHDIAANDTLELIQGKAILDAGDTIKCQVESTDIEIYASGIEL